MHVQDPQFFSCNEWAQNSRVSGYQTPWIRTFQAGGPGNNIDVFIEGTVGRASRYQRLISKYCDISSE
jgi:hypothetical protein